jgi:hypothetical protein
MLALLTAAAPAVRTIGFLVLPGVCSTELVAPYDVFRQVRF